MRRGNGPRETRESGGNRAADAENVDIDNGREPSDVRCKRVVCGGGKRRESIRYRRLRKSDNGAVRCELLWQFAVEGLGFIQDTKDGWLGHL